jgi:Domain of unknown function (DUF4377)
MWNKRAVIMGVGVLLVASVGVPRENDPAVDVAVGSWLGISEQAGSPAARDGGDDETWIEEIEVSHYKQPCKTLVTAFCLVSRKSEAHPWRLQDWIDGFTPVWGVSARLRVRVRRIANPPADGSSMEYRLEEVLSTTPAPPGTEFELVFAPGWARELVMGEPNALSLKGERSLACADSTVCAELNARRRSPDRGLRLTLRHPSKPEDSLLVVRLADWP